MPHLSNDPVVTAAHLITSLQTIVSRATDPLKTAVVTISKIKGGSAHNIITDRVELEGTVRTFDQDLREYVKKRFFEMIKHVAYMFSNEAEIEYVDGYPATVNTPKWAQLARRSVKDLFGEDATPDVSPSMASEDFSRFLEEIPGAFIWLGTCLEEQEKQKGLHDSSFDINEASLEYGTALLAKIAYDTLEELKKKSG